VDSSPNSANGVATNTTAATDRHSSASEAATFNGVDASITASGYNGVTGSGARTLSGWVRVDPANSGPIIAYGSGANTFEVHVAAGGTLEVIADAATLTGTTNLTDSAWHHFVVMFPEGGSPSNISIRIDGSSESYASSGDTASTLATASSSAVLIGTNSVGQFFTGDIDEVRLYERRMLAWEGVDLYTLEASPQPAEVPVSISTQPATTVVAFGDSTSLSVTATATPAPIYQWEAQYEGTWHFIEGETSSTLNFASATDYDGRAYRVSIIDNHGNVTISNQARLYVLHPPTLAEPEPDISFVVNVGGKISANVSGSAKMYYEWFKDSVSLGAPSTARGIVIPNTATQATHGGSYHYIATNSVGTLTSNTFTVSIIDPVTITVHPVPTGIIAGDNGSLSVTATGGGTLQYQWYEYDKTTGARTAVDGETSATLNFTTMDASQEGIYGCEVTNGPSTRWSKFVLVTMYVAPVFTTQPTDLTVNEFDFVQIDSLATGVPNPTYQWQKYNTTTTLWEDVTNFVYPFLRYKTVRAEMAGTYRVEATNAAGTATSDQAVLTVYYKPVITSDIYNVTANEDTDVTFTVGAHGLDSGGATITYQWYFNGVAMTDGAEISGSTTNSLTLTTVNKADNYGKYYCTLTNAMGTVQSRTAVIYIVEKPYALTTLVDQTIDEGQKLYLWVYVKGTKPLTMQWYKDGVPIPGAIYTKYTISAVVPGDAGLYSFIVSNAAGSFQQDANITVTSASTASAGALVMKKDTSDPYGDADGDGLGNLLEEALGSNPSDPNSTFYPDIEILDGGDGKKYASIQYSISKTTEGISVILEQSADLKNWQPVNLSKATITSLNRPTYTTTTVYLPVESANLFFRVQATK